MRNASHPPGQKDIVSVCVDLKSFVCLSSVNQCEVFESLHTYTCLTVTDSPAGAFSDALVDARA